MFYDLLLILIFNFSGSSNQKPVVTNTIIQETQASSILEKVSHALHSYKTLQLYFNLNLETYSSNKIKIKANKSGVFKMKGKKYYAGIREQEFFFDGIVLKVYDKRNNELQISQPDPHKNTGIGLNPQQIFTDVDFYKKGFQYRLNGKTMTGRHNCWQIELVPIDKTLIFSKIWLYVSENNFRIRKAVITDKKGSKYTYSVRRMIVNKELGDEIFNFNEAAYKNVEIIDLR